MSNLAFETLRGAEHIRSSAPESEVDKSIALYVLDSPRSLSKDCDFCVPPVETSYSQKRHNTSSLKEFGVHRHTPGTRQSCRRKTPHKSGTSSPLLLAYQSMVNILERVEVEPNYSRESRFLPTIWQSTIIQYADLERMNITGKVTSLPKQITNRCMKVFKKRMSFQPSIQAIIKPLIRPGSKELSQRSLCRAG